MSKKKKIVLAYSGGLDTSVLLSWIKDKHNAEMIAFCADIGQEDELKGLKQKAMKTGASKLYVDDLQAEFARDFIFPMMQAGAIYEGQYYLGTSIARPLIAKRMVEIARQEGATAIAHGATGKGNDQVRFELTCAALAPDLEIIAPWRNEAFRKDFPGRAEMIAYCADHKIPVEASAKKPYSSDRNLLHISFEAGILEDPWHQPPEDVYEWTKPLDQTPAQPAIVEIRFEKGYPVALDGVEMTPVELVSRLSDLGGEHGIGRIDMVENRLVGIKSREIYESPAAVILLEAHRVLEELTLSKQQNRFKGIVSQEYADLIYNGQWFTAHHRDLSQYVASTQRHVTGDVKMRLWHGTVMTVGRRADRSLYSAALATYNKQGDLFDQSHAQGFIKLHGLQAAVQAQRQMLTEPGDLLRLAAPNE